jgi:hypothetical protein
MLVHKAVLAVLSLLLLAQPLEAREHPIHWDAPKACLKHSLAGVMYEVSRVSPVVVTSTCRSKAHNRKVGGAKKSYHLRGMAVDFRVRPDKSQEVMKVILADARVGGYKLYRPGKFHIDSGPRRTWNATKKLGATKSKASQGNKKKLRPQSQVWHFPSNLQSNAP